MTTNPLSGIIPGHTGRHRLDGTTAFGTERHVYGTQVGLRRSAAAKLQVQGALGGIRTPNLLIRSRVYWVTEDDRRGPGGREMPAQVHLSVRWSANWLVTNLQWAGKVWHGDSTELVGPSCVGLRVSGCARVSGLRKSITDPAWKHNSYTCSTSN